MDPRKPRSRRKLSQYALAVVHQAIAPQGGLSFGQCPLLAQSGHGLVRCTCPLSGVKRTFRLALPDIVKPASGPLTGGINLNLPD